MGNCGGAQKELSLDAYMQRYHPAQLKPVNSNFELSKKVLGGLNGNVFQSEPIELHSEKYPMKEQQPRVKIPEALLKEGTKIGNRSSIRVYQTNQVAKTNTLNNGKSINVEASRSNQLDGDSSTSNPFDVNLLDLKESILLSQTFNKFSFNDYQLYSSRHVIVTKNAIRVYENKAKALASFSKPLLAVPLSAVQRIERIKFDMTDDKRLERPDERIQLLNNNQFEIILKDEFLPMYTHLQYNRMFKDTSMAIELSPGKRRSVKKSTMEQSSAQRESTASKQYSQYTSKFTSGGVSSPQKVIDMHKKTGIELRESPSKGSKIAMKYINGYPDVGPLVPQQQITYNNLVEMSKEIDKKEWVRSDLRLIFGVEDYQTIDEGIEQFNKILKSN